MRAPSAISLPLLTLHLLPWRWRCMPAANADSSACRKPAHHRADGFQNNYVEFEPKG
jgi:hypothetical protein